MNGDPLPPLEPLHPPLELVVLISGRGLNLKTVLEAIDHGRLNARVLEVICNRRDAPGLAHAARHRVPCRIIDAASAGPAGQDAAIAARLRELRPDLVLLSGYMRILGDALVEEFRGRMINQHPSLLPRHKGLHTHRRALEAGDREHGASIHFVTAELDGGPVIAQVRVPVEPGDDEEALAARVGPLEHGLLLGVLDLFCARRLAMRDDAAVLDSARLDRPLQLIEGELTEGVTHA
jgi:phosphoribosylglycinamide formyltransferase-1